MPSLPTPARESTVWKHVPSQPLDAITAFTVPNPNCTSQRRRFFQVWLPRRLPHLADHSVYFGSARFISLSLSTVDGTHLNRAFINVNANYWCTESGSACEYQQVQDVLPPPLMNFASRFEPDFHRNFHSSPCGRKSPTNHRIVLTPKNSRRI